MDKTAQSSKPEPTQDDNIGLAEITLDAGRSFVQSSLISPVWNGLGQLVSGGRLPQISITNEESASHSQVDAWAQKIAGAAGVAVDFAILATLSKGAAAETVQASTARSIGLGESALTRLGESARVGAAYGAFLVPSTPGDNILAGRLKNAVSSGVTFGALGGLSEFAGGVGVLGKMQPNTLAFAVKDMGVSGVTGLPAGALGAEVDSYLNHGTKASWQSIKSQAIDYGVIGFIMPGITHGASAFRSKPAQVADALEPVHFHLDMPEPLAYKMPELEPVQRQPEVDVHGTIVSSVLHDLPVGRVGHTIYENGTEVEHHIDLDLKVTTLPDQTKITESSRGVRTEHADGSEVNVTSYRTESRSVDGKWTFEENHWTRAWENWENLGSEEKTQILTTVDQIPKGGNLVANLVEKGLAESDSELQAHAVKGITHITNAEEQVNQWNLALNYNEPFKPELIDMLPQLSQNARSRILSGYGTDLTSVYEGLSAKAAREGSSEPDKQAALDYLDMLRSSSKEIRKSVWDTLNETLDPTSGRAWTSNKGLRPLAENVMDALATGDARAVSALQEFSNLPAAKFKAIERISTAAPERKDIAVKPGASAEAQFQQVQQILLAAEAVKDPSEWNKAAWEAQVKVSRILRENQDLAFQKMINDWGNEQKSAWIKDLINRELDDSGRVTRLEGEFSRLLYKDELPSDFQEYMTRRRPSELRERASEYYVSHDQVAATLQNTLQLMQIADANRGPDGELTRAGNQFRMAGLQTMAQAGDPFLITQGQHPTCAIAQLELSTFLKNPDEASRMINEVMRTGKFVTTDGTTIGIDPESLRPEDSSLEMNRTRTEKPDYAYRSYVSQIFQTTAANIYWQRQTTVPDGTGRQVPPGSLRYEIHFKTGRGQDSSVDGKKPEDLLLDYSSGKPVVIAKGPRISDLQQLVDIGEQLAGPRTRPSVTMKVPNTVEDFEKYLLSLPYPEAFPLILPIDANALADPSLPFKGLNHAISILAPWQGGKRVYFHNTWSPGGKVDMNLNRDRFWEISSR